MSAGPQRQVVDSEQVSDGVLLIRMNDPQGRNAFSDSLLRQLREAFEDASTNTALRCVVLAGLDRFFSVGGTQENLLAIHDGRTTFLGDDGAAGVYALPLECPIPVVAALQGHAIGGGLSLGLFADVVLMARESVYSAIFMKYGFTPGFGSTLIFPERLGHTLGSEMLLTGDTYRGSTLAARGAPFEILPRLSVEARALEVAAEIATRPRTSLMTLKRHLTRRIVGQLDEVIRLELAMHEETFHQPEVRARLLELYHS